jgi:1-acyl-sn-glycerol-3-phosphate acyltransferase
MTRSELARVQWAPEPASERLVRTGSRVAGMGLATLAAAARLRLLRFTSRFSSERAASIRDGARERALVLRDASRRMLALHGIELDASGPLPLGPAILAANHVSWLDPLVVASLLPCVPISKGDVSAWPVVGGIARELGVVFVTRGNARSGMRVLRATQVALGHGLPVLNFPEGTTTRGESVLPFRKGVFGIARSAGVPVVPVALAYDPPELAWVGDDTFLPHWLKLASSRRARAFARLGAPIPAPEFGSALELARTARAEVARLLREVR